MKSYKICLYVCVLSLFFNILNSNLALAISSNRIYWSNSAKKSSLPNKLNSDILFTPKITPKYSPTIIEKYSYELLFNMPSNKNFQGLTFFNKHFYCGFDLGGAKGKIIKYDILGRKIFETKPMFVGHCAELGYRSKTGKIYIANGGGTNLTHVYVVDYAKSLILKNLKYEKLGTSALLAIDNVHDYLILHTILKGGDIGNPTFTIINLATMNVLSTFNVSTQGVPQGLETDGSHIYLYTNNKITVFDYSGAVITTFPVNKSGESEGLTLASESGTSFLAMGYTSPNRIYALRLKNLKK